MNTERIPTGWYWAAVPQGAVRGEPDPERDGFRPSEAVGVLIVEQNPLLGSALHGTLQGQEDISVTGLVRNGEEAIAHLRSGRADVVVCQLEAALAGEDAILTHLRRHMLVIPVVAILSHVDARTWLRGHRAGIHGWISVESVPALLPEIVRCVARAAYCADYDAIEFLVDELVALRRATRELERKLSSYESPLNGLTGRQREILKHLAEGLMTRQIAERLYLSESTVKGHVTNILSKLGVENRDEAVALARKLDVSE